METLSNLYNSFNLQNYCNLIQHCSQCHPKNNSPEMPLICSSIGLHCEKDNINIGNIGMFRNFSKNIAKDTIHLI